MRMRHPLQYLAKFYLLLVRKEVAAKHILLIYKHKTSIAQFSFLFIILRNLAPKAKF